MNQILFSILTPSVPSRFEQLKTLWNVVETQIGEQPVEHLVLTDNKRRSVGEKRDALLRAARSAYIAFVDDDDWIADDYVSEILRAIAKEPDVITFQQQATVNGKTGLIDFKLGNENEAFKGAVSSDLHIMPIVKRNAWHVCAWRRTLAIQSHFPAINYGEDWAFAAPLCKIAKSEEHIAKVLHYYRHSAETTEAPLPLTAPTSFPPADVFHVATGA